MPRVPKEPSPSLLNAQLTGTRATENIGPFDLKHASPDVLAEIFVEILKVVHKGADAAAVQNDVDALAQKIPKLWRKNAK